MSREVNKFENWWGQIQPTLQRVLFRIAGAGAVDVVQDVAVLALRNFDRFESYEDFARWCTVRGKWLALDELARNRRRPTASIESVEAQLEAADPSQFAEVLSLVDQLPDRQRQVVVYKLMGYRTDEIARAMKIQENAVRSHWRFARQTLSEQMRNP